MKVNKTIFELDVVYQTISLGKILEMTDAISISIEQMEDMKMQLDYKTIIHGISYETYTKLIDEQLSYCLHNHKILVDALLIHEQKIVEKRTNLGDLGVMWLN